MIEFVPSGRNVFKFFFVVWDGFGFFFCVFALAASPRIDAALAILMWIGGMLFIGVWGLLCGIRITSDKGLPVYLDPNVSKS